MECAREERGVNDSFTINVHQRKVKERKGKEKGKRKKEKKKKRKKEKKKKRKKEKKKKRKKRKKRKKERLKNLFVVSLERHKRGYLVV